MTAIFLSHASDDAKLAEAFVTFLKDAVGVPAKEIFCSSVTGHNVPTGVNFNQYMKDRIQNPALVIMLITETYIERPFCLMELGACWAQSNYTYPIIVEPAEFGFVTKTLGLVQSVSITDFSELNGLRDTVGNAVELEDRTDTDWDNKRKLWKSQVKRIIKKLPNASKVSAEDHQELKDEIDGLNQQIESNEGKLEEQNYLIDRLRAAKDSDAVAEIESSLFETNLSDRFEELVKAVKAAKPANIGREVFLHLIMDHYGKAASIDWSYHREEFTAAVQYNLIDQEDDAVKWSNSKAKKLQRALHELDEFMSDPDSEPFIAELERDDFEVDPDDLGFWEENL